MSMNIRKQTCKKESLTLICSITVHCKYVPVILFELNVNSMTIMLRNVNEQLFVHTFIMHQPSEAVFQILKDKFVFYLKT